MTDRMSPYSNLLGDYAHELQRLLADVQTAGDSDFDKGRVFGLQHALSLLKQQMIAFQIDEDAIGTTDIPDPL